MKLYAPASVVALLTVSASQLSSVLAQGPPPGVGGPPGGPPPMPLVITSDTILSAPQTLPIVIGADHITLDCDGNTIAPFPGPPTFVDGISMNNRIGITIKNCSVKNWLRGIVLEAFSSVELENIEIDGNLVNGLDANDGSHILMKGSFKSNNNGVFGISMQNDVSLTMKQSQAECMGNTAGVQIGLRSSYTMIQDRNSAPQPSTLETYDNTAFGITATSNSHLFLFGTTAVKAYNNGSNGVTAFTKSAIELDRDATIESYNNALNGFRVEDSSVNMFTVNPATVPVLKSYGNGEAGVFLGKVGVFDTNDSAVTEISGNTGGGLVVDNNSVATVRGANIHGNTLDGEQRNVIVKFGSHGDFEGNTIEGDVIHCDYLIGNYLRGDYWFCKRM